MSALGMKTEDITKALETPEEKRLRRLAKKAAKETKRKLKLIGYTNEDNPFNDPEFDKPFIWWKKYEALGIKNIDEIHADIERIRQSNIDELEKIRKRRQEREKEREERTKEMEARRRDEEAGKFRSWVDGEEQFLFKQAKLRSEVRMKEGRAKPIDWLVAYINASGNESEYQEHLVEPYRYLNGLRLSDMEDLQEDIRVYKQLDSTDNLEYWKDLEIIVQDELLKLKCYQASKNQKDDGINPSVAKEQNKILTDKTPSQLVALQAAIEKKMANHHEVIDISYWENLLAKVKAHMARARLRDRHKEILRKMSKKEVHNQSQPESMSDENDQDDEYVDPLEACIEEYQRGCYSPTLLNKKDVDSSLIINPDEDLRNLDIKRQMVLSQPSKLDKTSTATAAELQFEKEARRGMGSDEGILRIEENIVQDPSIASWSEKYRPRKPRYFNRVHTGFEWNKYNQTHYDIDNPPPKIVQGYKFNIFYPDLIDKSKTPTYTVTPCADNKDFAIIKFKAGPPYEDIAFKIVNREWNYSYKSGFRRQFSNNILQLWFHFKRYRYRR